MAKKPRLLIVDDEDEIRENLVDYVEYKEFDALQASNGSIALEMVRAHAPDLILSDLMMPEMNGIELLHALESESCDIPIVIMTAYGTLESAVEAMKAGAADFVTKPIDLPYMIKVINRVLERSAMEQKLKDHQRQMDEDLHLAASIQRSMLPGPIETSALSLQYRYEPLIEIGGDYMTVHCSGERNLAVALYDVSGHGVSAALVANLVHHQLIQRLNEHRPLSNVVDLLNRYIIQHIGATNMFITLALCILDVEASEMRVTNAGHPDVLVWRNRDERIASIGSHVSPIGFTERILAENNETLVPIDAGDRVMLYTDGFLEARDAEGAMLGKSNLIRLLEGASRLSPQAFLEKVFSDYRSHQAGDPDDDLTFVVIDVK